MVCGITVAAGLVCMVATAAFVEKSDSIYIGIGSTDCGEREVKYLDMQNLPGYFNSVVYEYPGPEGGMYEFEGNIVVLEYVRKIVSAGVWGSVAVSIVSVIGCTVCGRRVKKNQE